MSSQFEQTKYNYDGSNVNKDVICLNKLKSTLLISTIIYIVYIVHCTSYFATESTFVMNVMNNMEKL